MSTPPKSVTVSEFLGLGQVPTPATLRAGGLQQLPDAGSRAHPAIRGLQAKFTALVDSN